MLMCHLKTLIKDRPTKDYKQEFELSIHIILPVGVARDYDLLAAIAIDWKHFCNAHRVFPKIVSGKLLAIFISHILGINK